MEDYELVELSERGKKQGGVKQGMSFGSFSHKILKSGRRKRGINSAQRAPSSATGVVNRVAPKDIARRGANR